MAGLTSIHQIQRGLFSMYPYDVEKKDCGCKIKKYAGGLISVSGCSLHFSKIRYVCQVCNKEFEKKTYRKKHMDEHAI